MQYSEFIELYESLSQTPKRLEKVSILASFLKKLKKSELIYLLKGKVFPDYDSKEFGISDKLVIKAISKASGTSETDLYKKYKKLGDLGAIADAFIGKRKQSTLFNSKLTAEKIFENLRKLVEIQGHGAVEKKLSIIIEILNSASGKEAKYIIRTLLSDLRIGVADGVLRDALAEAFFPNESMSEAIERAYDISNDYAVIFESASKGKKHLEEITIMPGKPIKVMLPIKVTNIEEAFRICGKPAAIEHKYDGFRVMINKDEKGIISLFTRRLENVTSQFPDVVEAIKKHLKANSFILDTEVVGFNPETKKYLPFEAISQRIKRKYDIEKLIKILPVEINVFDIIYLNGKIIASEQFKERRKILEKLIPIVDKKIRPSMQFVTDDEKKALEFYTKTLSSGEEGIMMKKLDAPYQAGRRVGYMIKMKPDVQDLDLVIVGAEYGSGKRAGWLTSYIVACKADSDSEKFLEVGKVSSGLKEKEDEDQSTTYEEMTNLLKPLILEEKEKEVKIKPKLVVSVTYQNIQKSSAYSSGYALRFPRITHFRPERGIHDIASLKDIQIESK
ncbi:MAG: ATP-dependent DNA ligase [Nanoarchaeota archaeon]|nr:ATP-dependent DNA ligase [Nanoarchaeota archaeon]